MSFPDVSDDGLSELEAMEIAMITIGSGNIDELEELARKRSRTEAGLATRPSSPDATADPVQSLSRITTPGPNQNHRPSMLNAVQAAKSLIAAKKRKTEHAAELTAFAELQDIERAMAIYDLLIELRTMFRVQYAENDNWTMSKNMKEDIRSYTQAVILAPAIPSYMPDNASIQNLLKSKGIYPAAWSIFPSRLTAMRQYSGTCATDMRADIKNEIKSSLKSGACLSALCQAIVANTEIKVTAAMRSRVAWLRFIYANHEAQRANKFWDFVDEQLRELRKKMNNDARRLATFMSFVVEKDEKRYTFRNDEVYTLAEDADLPQFQLAAHTAAKAIVPVLPKTA